MVTCDRVWGTLSGRIAGWVGEHVVEMEISVDAARRWYLNAKEQAQVEGCIDLDLNFSPSTNLLPIRRLNLLVGQEAMVRAAWLRFPSFELEPLDQLYRRIDESTYVYESGGGTFVRQLEVESIGLRCLLPRDMASRRPLPTKLVGCQSDYDVQTFPAESHQRSWWDSTGNLSITITLTDYQVIPRFRRYQRRHILRLARGPGLFY